MIIIEKRYKTSYDDSGKPMSLIGSYVDYLDTFYNFENDFCDEITIIFISDLNDVTFFHYLEQPRSMLCRKLEKKIFEEDFEDFDYNWLPNWFRQIKR